MTTKLVRLIPAVAALITSVAFSPAARANGSMNFKSCFPEKINVCLYDWNDSVTVEPRHEIGISAYATGYDTCRKSWSSADAPGCQVKSSIGEGCDADFGRQYSGRYTIWAEPSNRDQWHMRSGWAADCAGGNPTEFTLSASELSGCTQTPKLTLYGTTDGSGDAYVVENMALSNMTRLAAAGGDMNDWVRSIGGGSGNWEICEDINFGGHCIIFSVGGFNRIDLTQMWSGNWDRKISSIKPTKCN